MQHSWSKAYWTKDQQPPHIFFKMVLSFTEKSNIFLRLSGNINMKKCLLFSAQVTGFGQESSIPMSRSANICTHDACVVRLYLAFSWKPGAWWLDLTSGAKSAGIWSTEDFSAPSAKGGDSGWHVHWEEAVITAALWWLHTAAPLCVLLNGLAEALSWTFFPAGWISSTRGHLDGVNRKKPKSTARWWKDYFIGHKWKATEGSLSRRRGRKWPAGTRLAGWGGIKGPHHKWTLLLHISLQRLTCYERVLPVLLQF